MQWGALIVQKLSDEERGTTILGHPHLEPYFFQAWRAGTVFSYLNPAKKLCYRTQKYIKGHLVSTSRLKFTLLSANEKQFFAAARSPFFQMQLPKHSHASTRDGFSFT